MARERRIELIKAIEEKRGSKVITYITSDRHGLNEQIQQDIVPILHKHLRESGADGKTKFDLVIYSRGGDSDIPWSIVSMFREYCPVGSFSVLIPFRAHSAATVIALGADEIVMTKKAELGPIDITLTGPFNPVIKETSQALPISVEDVMGYFSLLDKISSQTQQEKLVAFQLISQQVHPIALGSVHRVLQQTELVAKRLLESRSKPLPDETNDKIAKMLGSVIGSHRHAINRTEALNRLGIEFVVRSEDVNIDDELWEMYEEYDELFQFNVPFDPESHLIANNLDQEDWKDLPICCVESEGRLDIKYLDVKIRRLRNIPPQISLNLANLELPPGPTHEKGWR